MEKMETNYESIYHVYGCCPSDKSEKEKCKALLYVIGQEGREIYNTFAFAAGDVDKLDVLIRKFEDFCIPKTNITVARHRFNTRVQGPSKRIDQYITELKLIAKDCSFENLEDGLIRDRIVCGAFSSRVKERLLREDNLSLEKAVSLCRADEECRKQIKTINEEEKVHALKKTFVKQRNPDSRQRGTPKKTSQEMFNCGRCRKKHEKGNFPAYGKTCYKCKKSNHFQKICKSKGFTKRRVYNLQEGSSDSECEDYNYFVGAVNKKTEISDNSSFTSFKVQGKTIKFKIHTGSKVNMLPNSIFQKLNDVKLTRTNAMLTSFSGDKLKVLGKCQLHLQNKELEFFVTETDQFPLLGFKALNEAGLIHDVMNVQSELDNPIKAFPKVFSGLGSLKKPYHIKLDESTTPVIHPSRNLELCAID
ncbi:uncharacterized protein LOC134257995 [Saccostrea cucullata]|uniref:uncharacterized protein LOC134257995 n=1 Tax=Saccostrea cuccullata TaxID=36930 RepID=UPI002ED2304C